MISARKKMRYLGNLTSTLLIFSSFLCYIQAAPAKPLNERSNELTWQAWLLVDDQNQNKQYDPDALIRRRITPKSVFIAPTFSPEALPDCGDGFTADNMGKCVKIIEIDKDAHLDFILHRLNEQFGTFEEFADYDDDSASTEGPYNVKIPLEEVQNQEDTDYDDNTNVAIVVAPTNGNFATLNDTFKINNIKRNNVTTIDVPLIVTKINVDEEDTVTATEESPATELSETITTVESTTLIEDTATTMEIETTTLLQEEEQALFFKFTNETKVNEPETSENKHTENFIQFPDTTKTSISEETQQTQQIRRQLLPHANVKTKYEDFNIFNEYTSHKTNAYKNRDTQHQEATDLKGAYNHRNRDKHWQFPPSWRSVSPQKPLVLRFNTNRKHHANNFYQNHPRQDHVVYREVPPDDLPYIFGFKRALSHR